MMTSRKDLALMASIMEGVTGSEEWAAIQTNDPGIQAAETRFSRALAAIRDRISPEEYMELSDAHSEAVTAYSDAATLYGIRVAGVFQSVAARPEDLARFYLDGRAAAKAADEEDAV